jgi:ribosomal protein L16 Arg81 hydroxylase
VFGNHYEMVSAVAQGLAVSPLGLQRLLAPKHVGEFLRDDLQKRPVVVHGRNPSIYQGLLTLEQIEQAIDDLDPRDGKCRLLGGDDAAGRRTVEASCELREVLAAYGRGASINLSGMDRRSTAVGELRRQLRNDFANHGITLGDHGDSVVFITPTNSQALKPHVDPDDLFVLQLEGRKRWNVYGWDPLWNQGARDQLPPITLEAELAPGDLLYVPQHWIHMASAGEDFSFALTVGFRPISWADVLGALSTRHLFGVAPLSEPVPAWAIADGRLSPQGRDRLAEVLKLLVDSPNLRQMMEYVDVKPRVAATNASSGIAAVNQVRRLGADTICALAGPAKVERHGDLAEIIVNENHKVRGPQAIEPALVWIAQQAGEFPVGAIGGALSENAKVVLARRLVLEGLMHIRPGEKVHS